MKRKFWGVKVKRKSVISENQIFLESLKKRTSQIPAYATVLLINVTVDHSSVSSSSTTGLPV